jgi:hypothetical protein
MNVNRSTDTDVPSAGLPAYCPSVISTSAIMLRLTLRACTVLTLAIPAAAESTAGSTLQKGTPYSSAKKRLVGAGWRLVEDAGTARRPFKAAPEISCGDGYQAICSATFHLDGRELIVAVKTSKRGLVVDFADE